MENLQKIMTEDVGFTTPDTSLQEIARMMVEYDCGEIPLVENTEGGKVIGVITDRDIVCRTLGVGKNPMDLTAQDCMTSPAVTATVDMSVDECLNLMEENQIRRIPVVDEEDKLCGIIAQADLLEFVDDDQAVDLVAKISQPTDSPSQVSGH